MLLRKPATGGAIRTRLLICLIGGVVTLGAAAAPASAQEPTTKGCSPVSVTGNRGETLEASGIQVANVSCSRAYDVVQGFHEQIIGSSGSTVVGSLGCVVVPQPNGADCRSYPEPGNERVVWKARENPVIKTISTRIRNTRIRLEAVRTEIGINVVGHTLRLRVWRNGRYVTKARKPQTAATAQSRVGDFCGLRIVARSRSSLRVRYCAKPSASIGPVSSTYTVTSSRISERR